MLGLITSVTEAWRRVGDEKLVQKSVALFISRQDSKALAWLENGSTLEQPLPIIYVRLEAKGPRTIKSRAYRGFTIEVVNGTFGSSSSSEDYALIRSTDTPFNDVFIAFSENLVTKLDEGLSPSIAVEQTVSEWLVFFKNAGQQPLDDD